MELSIRADNFIPTLIEFQHIDRDLPQSKKSMPKRIQIHVISNFLFFFLFYFFCLFVSNMTNIPLKKKKRDAKKKMVTIGKH